MLEGTKPEARPQTNQHEFRKNQLSRNSQALGSTAHPKSSLETHQSRTLQSVQSVQEPPHHSKRFKFEKIRTKLRRESNGCYNFDQTNGYFPQSAKDLLN